MATLRVKLEESKTEPKAVFIVECSNDIKESIVQSSKDMFEVEIINSGSIITTADSTTIQMIVTDSDKIKFIRIWIMNSFLKLSNLDNLNKN